jgi:hypothetical protein
LFGAIRNNGNGGDLIGAYERGYARYQQAVAQGSTPPPLMAGSAPLYGWDGNRTAPEAMVQAGQTIRNMSSVALMPFYFTPVAPLAAAAGVGDNLANGEVGQAALAVGLPAAFRLAGGMGRLVGRTVSKCRATALNTLSTSGVRSGPRFGYDRLRRVEEAINSNAYRERVIFGTSANAQERDLALRILAEAERRTSLPTNALTARTPAGDVFVVFRNRNVTTAEVMEELRHLGQTRSGVWNLGFEAREIEAGAYLHRLYTGRGGLITELQCLETIANVARYTGLSPEAVILIFRAGVRPAL